MPRAGHLALLTRADSTARGHCEIHASACVYGWQEGYIAFSCYSFSLLLKIQTHIGYVYIYKQLGSVLNLVFISWLQMSSLFDQF